MAEPITRLAPITTTATTNQAPALAPRAVGATGAVAGLGLSVVNPLLGALVSGGSMIAAQVLQNKYTQQANELARKQFLADRAHDEWYNSPAMQKLRLKEAGLSPADFIGSFETSSSGAPTPQAPDMSFLSQAGSAGVQGMINMQTYEQNKKEAAAKIDLLYAQAEEMKQRARTAQQRYDLEVAGKVLENSKLGKDLDFIQLSIQGAILDNKGKSIQNDTDLLNYVFNRDSKEYRMEALELANRLSKLDEKQKQLANDLAEETKELTIQLLAGQVKGVKLDNDLKTVTINGKQYELENLLPAQLTAYNDKHQLSAEQKKLLIYGVHQEKLRDQLATGEYNAIKAKWDEYVKLIQTRLSLDYKSASMLASGAAARAMFGQRSGYTPIVDFVLEF